MRTRFLTVALAVTLVPSGTSAQAMTGDEHAGPMHGAHAMNMLDVSFAGGWSLRGMGQVFPIFSTAATSSASPLEDSEFRLTQPVGMFDLVSPGGRFSLRVSPNLEGITQEDGELTTGGWGEGFIDRRHPHTVLHEVMASVNLPTRWGGVSISGGKGFAPYGTEDPMSRPVLKYPTNHHLSQILERFTLNGTLLIGAWSLEAGVFGGSEPEDAWDLSNVDSFADSWSARVTRRFGDETGMGVWASELSASFGSVHHGEHDDGDEPLTGATEEHDEPTKLVNVALRVDRPAAGGRLYALVEASRNWQEEMDDGYRSVLAEGRFASGRHTTWARVEWATRPEYPREGTAAPGFFRYDHDAEPIGASAWTITTVGYGWTLTEGAVSIRPFVEAQAAWISPSRGAFDPGAALGADRVLGLSVGARIFLGGDPMRMGTYGVLDPMTRPMPGGSGAGMHMN